MVDPRRRSCPTFTRRQFLSSLGATVAVAAAGGFGISVWGRADAASGPGAFTAGPAAGAPLLPHRTLVVIEMGGGNDGLNTVVPHADPRYHDLRRALAIEDPIDLDGDVGLHPNLGFVAERYRAGDVAIVEGIGYPQPDLSHFASMATWWSGQPGAIGATGWLGRHLDLVADPADPLAGVVIGPGPSPALAGERSFSVAIQDLTGLSPQVPPWIDSTDELLAMWRGFAPARFDDSRLLDRVRRAIAVTVDAASELETALDGLPEETARGARGRRSSLGESMAIAAALVSSARPPAVIYIHGWGDFDTHEGQLGRHAAMMEDLDTALSTFFGAVESTGAAGNVVVMTTSEFGRRAATNGGGTDHGTAAAHLLIGDPVRGGRFGDTPRLDRLDSRGNLVHTVDYRTLYASVLDGWLASDASMVLQADHETLPLFSPAESARVSVSGRHVR